MEVRCPKCGKNAHYEDNPYRPFCSKRCRMSDLYGWMEEEYVINGKGEGEDDQAPPADRDLEK